MILNMEQQKAVENGEPVALNVAGTECVLIRRDIYLRLDPDYDTGPVSQRTRRKRREPMKSARSL